MILFKKGRDLRLYLEKQREQGKKYGFVPTMGALHNGHVSLIRDCKTECDLTVCSIFINPTQFNDATDFEKYPVTLEKDIQVLAEAGCDVLFQPSVKEMYPDGTHPGRVFDFGSLETLLEGKFRPGHFQGVGTIVDRLLEIVQPHALYMGQKDYQQCMVIRELLRITGKEEQIHLHISPTQREPDGLAMSSRNTRLNAAQRKIAPGIYQTLQSIRENFTTTPPELLKEDAIKKLTDKGFKVDYVEIADAQTLQPANGVAGNRKLVALVAAFLGEVRLIDNITLN